jgi:serine/threonine-protein kinase
VSNANANANATGNWFDESGTVVPPTVEPGAAALGGRQYEANALIAGKYQLSELLGQGGMGAVWLAKNRTLDVEVAVKVMRSELAGDIDGIAERMLQEARAAASVGHPAIVKVFDFGLTEKGDPFIVMELLRGESLLAAMRRRGRLSPTRAAQTLLPIVDALHATHARGIVHRDLKPENIFLARSADHRLTPKVLDFGIAKLERRAQERLTLGGAVIGSPAYMAPEQLRGEADVDARADIWALGVVLYEMISGRRPFEGENYHASMWNVLNAPPRGLAEHGIAEAELGRILERALAKERADRYADVQSFGRELASWLTAQGIHEDVCGASLAAWQRAPAEVVAVNSFFPSHAPRQEERSDAEGTIDIPEVLAPQNAGAGGRALGAATGGGSLGRAGVQKLAGEGVALLGSDAGPSAGAPPQAGVRAGAHPSWLKFWLPATVILAAMSFLLAAFWFGQRQALSPSGYTALLSGIFGASREGEGADAGRDGEADAELGDPDSAESVPVELPPSRLKYAPLAKNGPNAPLIYIDGPQPAPR